MEFLSIWWVISLFFKKPYMQQNCCQIQNQWIQIYEGHTMYQSVKTI
jgi:hypothetical protein